MLSTGALSYKRNSNCTFSIYSQLPPHNIPNSTFFPHFFNFSTGLSQNFAFCLSCAWLLLFSTIFIIPSILWLSNAMPSLTPHNVYSLFALTTHWRDANLLLLLLKLVFVVLVVFDVDVDIFVVIFLSVMHSCCFDCSYWLLLLLFFSCTNFRSHPPFISVCMYFVFVGGISCSTYRL